MADLLQFNLKNLADLDNGKANLVILQQLQNIVHDVKQRPMDKAKRTVQVDFVCTPKLAENGAFDCVEVQIKIKSKVPQRQTQLYPMLTGPNNTLQFSAASPNDPRQTTLFPKDEGGAHAEAPRDDRDDDEEAQEI